MQKELVATLRGHSAGIVGTSFFYMPSQTAYTVGTETVPLLTPTLVSCDESGGLIWWDLHTRRPLYCWQACEGSVLSVQQLGISWIQDKPVLGDRFGQLLVHGKDGMIKIFQLFYPTDVGFTYGVRLQKKLDFANECPNVVYELPCNVLNFCNVAMQDDFLVTPATVDAQGFDLYEIKGKDLKRKVANYQYARVKTGIVMKFQWLNESELVVGYESGLSVVFNVEFSGENATVNERYSFDQLCPDPVTSIASNATDIFISSAGSSVMQIATHSGEAKIHNIKHKGVNYMCLEETSHILNVATWDGYIRIYKYDPEFEFVSKIRRTSASIASEGIRGMTVSTSMCQKNVNTSDLVYLNGMSKNIIRRNTNEKNVKQWMVIGFDDGRLGLYSIGKKEVDLAEQ